MAFHSIAIFILIVIFVVGTVRPVNLGALALVATFVLGGLVAGEDMRTIYAGFPADLFVLLVGVTYLFGIASKNGSIEWLANAAARLIRGKRALLPWIIFFVSAVPATVGALGPPAVAMLAPVCLRLAKKYNINPKLAGLMIMHGSTAANFSPVNPLGAIVNGIVQRSGFQTNPLALFAASFAYNVVLAVVIYLLFGGIELMRRNRARTAVAVAHAYATVHNTSDTGRASTGIQPMSSPADLEPPPQMNLIRAVTLTCIVAAATGALVFRLDLGMLTLCAGVLLHLVSPSTSKGALSKVSWTVVLLICGIVTYMSLLQRMGTITFIGQAIVNIGEPKLAAFLLCAIAAATSAFASSTGIMGALIPMSVPLLSTGQVSIMGAVIALAISTTVVDSSPFSNVGAVVLANYEEAEQEEMYRTTLRWGLAMVVTAPIATWFLFILTTS
jgi:Na+/H+ antiporter NhaD/arsenite permease-like protein